MKKLIALTQRDKTTEDDKKYINETYFYAVIDFYEPKDSKKDRPQKRRNRRRSRPITV